MPNVKIIPNEPNNAKDFVGMKFCDGEGKTTVEVEATFPLGYSYSAESEQDALKAELYGLLTAINRHSRNDNGELEGITSSHPKDFPLGGYVTVIRDFMQHGYYIEREVRYQCAPMGKINWKRTIAQVKPMIQNGNAIYTDFIIRKTEKKTDKLISLIHEWCVYEAFRTLGFLFTSFTPHKPQLDIAEAERQYFVSVIREALNTTFNDRNKLLFNAMIQMLENAPSDNSNPFFYGTTHFHTVWENLIDMTYGIPDKSEYQPTAKWVMYDDCKGEKENTLRPDTIMIENDTENGKDDIFVLDAKYYSYVRDFHLPGAADIHKQIAYGKYAYEDVGKKKKSVYNAFLIPSFCQVHEAYEIPCKCIGYAVLAKGNDTQAVDKEYEAVLGILVDTKWLMTQAGNVDKAALAKFIRNPWCQKVCAHSTCRLLRSEKCAFRI